ncbi:MAG: 5'/3'-nucleotidase SurE [Paludibacteraceae bacterium]|nr:5'/3'-nucleotidase SurE [Paludibacteraceae bacterium]MBQ6985033.1 5'/3'-nucleotidase SurE [Paludibacteraceae bacterium]
MVNIVVVNDDGWGTAGVRLLAKEMTKLGHVTVIAPDGPRSGNGACITVDKPICLTRVEEHDLNGAEVYVTNGTPADCIKLAREVVFKDKPIDLIVSGINHGSNASINAMYSGTIGACLVAAEKGIPAIGWSINSHEPDVDLHWLQPYLSEVTQHLFEEGIAARTCFNINAPVGEIEGIRWTRQCAGHWANELVPIEGEKPEGVLSAWKLAGDFINDEPSATDTDIWAMNHQLLAITPLTLDWTEYGSL